MAPFPRRHQVQNNTTLTVSGNSGTLPNLSFGEDPTIIATLDIQGTVSGTSPSLTVTIYGWTGSNRKAQLGAFSAQTASLSGGNPVRITIAHVLEENIEVDWAISGTTPSFGGVSIDLLFPSPAS